MGYGPGSFFILATPLVLDSHPVYKGTERSSVYFSGLCWESLDEESGKKIVNYVEISQIDMKSYVINKLLG